MYLWSFVLVLISFLVTGSSFSTNYTNKVQKIVENISNQRTTTSLNKNCVDQLKLFLANLHDAAGDDAWALRMIDASFKVPAGVLEFNVAWPGRYEQCLKIESNKEDVKGKYCLATIYFGATSVDESVVQTSSMLGIQKSPKEITHLYKFLKSSQLASDSFQAPILPSLGFCIPHKCADHDLQDILSTVFPSSSLSITCQTKEDFRTQMKSDLGAIMTISFFGFFIVLMIISTIYDMRAVKINRKHPHPLLIAFSVYTNGQKLFKVSKNSGEFSSLHGIRFLSMVWVVYGHTMYVTVFGPLVNILDALKYFDTKESMIFGNAPLSVDTFFVLTGMLVVYNFMKMNTFNIILFYVHRYIRLTPPIIPAILASAFLTKYMGSGPYYPQTRETVSEPCRTNWWMTILYLKNLFGLWSNEELENFCLLQTWYINVDWQIFLLSPVFLLFLPKYPKIGLSIMISAIVASMGASFWATWHFQLQALQTNIYGNAGDFSRYYYLQTYTRASTWLIGGILGYILGKLRLDNRMISFKAPKWLIFTVWTIVLTAILTCIYAGHDILYNQTYHPYSNAFWNTFARPAWALCIAWIIFACAVGYGGIINSILSWPLFQVLARFTYSIYLVHLSILVIISSSQKQPGYFSLFNMGKMFWGGFTLSFALSIFWVLAFESPVMALEKYLLGRGKTTRIK